MWQIECGVTDDSEPIRLLPRAVHGLFRSDRCYMVLHTYSCTRAPTRCRAYIYIYICIYIYIYICIYIYIYIHTGAAHVHP